MHSALPPADWRYVSITADVDRYFQRRRPAGCLIPQDPHEFLPNSVQFFEFSKIGAQCDV